MTDSGRVSAEQLIAEWETEGIGRLSGEQLIAEWETEGIGRLPGEQLIAEWETEGIARLSSEHILAEWVPPSAARLTDVQLLVEWDEAVAANLMGTGSIAAAAWTTMIAAAALPGAGQLTARASGTEVLRTAASDLNFGGLFDRLLAEGTETAGSITVSLAGSASDVGYGFTPADFPGVQGATGDYTVKVNVTTGNNRIFLSVLIGRMNATGTTQATSSVSGEQTATAGVKTFTFPALNLGVWQPGDRLMVQYRFRNSQNMSNSTVIQTGTVNAAVTTPWSVPQGKASLKGTGALTASAVVIGPTNAAATAAAQTTVSGAAEKSRSGTASYGPDGSLDWDVELLP